MRAAVRAGTLAGRPAAKTLTTIRPRSARTSRLQSSYPVSSTDQSATAPSRYSTATCATSPGRLVFTRLAGPADASSVASPVILPGYRRGHEGVARGFTGEGGPCPTPRPVGARGAEPPLAGGHRGV